MERTSPYRTIASMVEASRIAIEGPRDGARAKSVALTEKKEAAITAAANVHWEVVQARMVESIGTRPWESLHKEIAERVSLGVNLVP